MTKISVVMSVYNTDEEYLRQAIESILNQTYKDFEFIIINDCSANNSKDVILSYDDSRIKYIENEKNLGLIKSLNKGVDLARGEYIARMDSDDIAFVQRFEKQVEYMDNHPDTGVLGTSMQILNCRKKPYALEGISPDNDEDENLKISMMFVQNRLLHSTVFIRKSIFDKYGKYSLKDAGAEDYGLWLRLSNKTNIENINEVLGYYTFHNKNYTYLHHGKNNAKAIYLRLKYQKKYYGIETKGIFKIILKLKYNIKLNNNELRKILKYYVNVNKHIGKHKTNRITHDFILSNCKKAIFNTKYNIFTPFAAFNPRLVKILVEKYLCVFRDKKFVF